MLKDFIIKFQEKSFDEHVQTFFVFYWIYWKKDVAVQDSRKNSARNLEKKVVEQFLKIFL